MISRKSSPAVEMKTVKSSYPYYSKQRRTCRREGHDWVFQSQGRSVLTADDPTMDHSSIITIDSRYYCERCGHTVYWDDQTDWTYVMAGGFPHKPMTVYAVILLPSGQQHQYYLLFNNGHFFDIPTKKLISDSIVAWRPAYPMPI